MADDKTFTKDDLDKAISDALDGVKTKNSELLDEVKDLKAKLRTSTGIKPEDLAALEAELDQTKVKLATAEKTAKDATKAKETAEASLKTEQGFTHKLVVENGLREQLTAAGVTDSVYQKAAMAMLSGQVQIAADGDNRVAKVGDKVLADFVKEWAGSDEGKRLVSAPANGGGGAQGGSGKPAAGKTMTREAYNSLEPMARAEAGMQMAKGELKVVDQAA
jgi:hypothetical protein